MQKVSLHRLIASLAALWATVAAAQLGALPETPLDAKPGECFGLVYVPPRFTVREESVLVAPRSERIEKVPAVYQYMDETVTLPAAKRRRIITPAVVETENETISVPARERRVKVPASYRTVKQSVTVATGPILKRGEPLPGQPEGAICLVEGPTAQQLVEKKVLDRPASVRSVVLPASERTVKRQKVLVPAVTELVPVPARSIKRRVRKLVTAETTRTVPVPARYETVSRREQQSPGRAEWQSVLCDTNFTPALVQSLQEALKREGIYKGPAHGQMNPQTVAAVRLFQERNALPTGGIGLATLDHLGVSLGEGQTLTQRKQ